MEKLWKEHYPDGVSRKPILVAQAIYEPLKQAAARWPERVAIDFLGRELCYSELWNSVEQVAAGLQARGMRKGTKVALLLPNCPAYIESYMGVLLAGGVVVNLNPLLSTGEVTELLQDSKAQWVVTADLKICTDRLLRLSDTSVKYVVKVAFAKELPAIKGALMRLVKGGDFGRIPRDSFEGELLHFDALKCVGEVKEKVKDPASELAVLQYTGGTTGLPKAAMLTHANVSVNAEQSDLWFTGYFAEDEQDVMLGVLPLFHVFAMTTVMNLGLRRGMKLVLLPRFDLLAVLKVIHKKRPTVIPGVPTMYNAIASYKDVGAYDLSSVNVCVSGGAGLPEEVKKKFEAVTGCTLVEGYGLTESSPVACANPPKQSKSGSIGLPLPATTITIRDVDDCSKEMKQGESGEICIAGPQVMEGYWRRDDETDDVMIKAKGKKPAYLRTGDVGYVADDGYIHIIDRKKEMILTRGYNVYPRHVEEVLYTHPDIDECAVIGLPHDNDGQRVAVCVVLRQGCRMDLSDCREFLEGEVAKYALPRRLEVMDELPKSMIGKILKKELVAMFDSQI